METPHVVAFSPLYDRKTPKLFLAKCQRQGTHEEVVLGYEVLFRSCSDSEADLLCVPDKSLPLSGPLFFSSVTLQGGQ